MTIRIFVHAPYDQYVTANTRFWNASGVDVSLDAAGFRVQTESLVSILIGGIAFQTPPTAAWRRRRRERGVHAVRHARGGDETARPRDAQPFVLVFRHSVRGLVGGRAGRLPRRTDRRGHRIGLEFDPVLGDFVQPVEVNLYPRRLAAALAQGRGDDAHPEERGGAPRRNAFLRRAGPARPAAHRQSAHGAAYVAVDLLRRPRRRSSTPRRRPFEIPTIPVAFEDVEASVASVAKKLDRCHSSTSAPTCRRSLATLEPAIKDADARPPTRRGIGAELNRTLVEAQRTLKSAQATVAPDSPLQTDLREALRETTRATASIRRLADHLQRQPQSVIRGKIEEEDE